jgi:anti-sigma regulatory factor (Ser/Thr protein kinase)
MGAPPELVQGTRWRQAFPGEERQLGILRRWVGSLLPDCPARNDVVLVADELGTNAIRHTASGRGGSFTVEIAWQEPVVRVAVSDSGGPGTPQVIDDPLAEHGRGLLLVRSLAARIGTAGDERGRTVWASILWDGPVPVMAADAYEEMIREDEAALARQFTGVMAWFGRATRQWWALPASGGLVSAPTAPDLAALLHQLGAGYDAAPGTARSREPASGQRRTRPDREPGGPSGRAESDSHLREKRGGAPGERGGGPGKRTLRKRPGSGRALAGRPRFALAPLSSHGEVA